LTIQELKEVLKTYPSDNFVHIRVWIDDKNYDLIVEKTQQGVDGSILLTTTLVITKPVKAHRWEFYMNGTFCKDCGTQIGSGQPCR